MFVKFHQLANGKVTLLPFHSIKYIVAHDDGGATISTNIPGSNPEKLRTFRSKESPEDIYNSARSKFSASDGILSYV